MKEKDAEKVADFIHDALQSHSDDARLSEIREMVYEFNRGFPLPE
jgi:glycine/serine hydroxymethyltransferase